MPSLAPSGQYPVFGESSVKATSWVPSFIASLSLSVFGSAAACSDSRCNPQNCQLALSCHLELVGATNGTCFVNSSFESFLVSDAGQAAVSQYCVDACNANNAGGSLQCLSQNFPGTSCSTIQQDSFADGGNTNAFLDAFQATCEAGDAGSCGAQCTSCQQQCFQTDQSCNGSCFDAGTASTCLTCNYNCNQQMVQCQAKCPTN